MGNKRMFKCCYGISSKADKNGGNALFLDYDKVTYEIVIEHLRYIQEEYSLSNIYLIKSTNGFNAVCLDVLPLSLCYAIGIDVMSPCDRPFFKYGYDRGYYTLRFDCDKTFFGIVRSDNNRYLKSLAHKNFLNWFFDPDLFIPPDDKFNGYSKVNLVQFPSDKDGYHLVDKVIPSYFDILKR
jgi:hypothetical protein